MQDSVSHAKALSINPSYNLLPENVKGNPHMFRGWRELLLWALINPQLLTQFDIETGAGLDINRGGMACFVSPERGFMVDRLAEFVSWYNRTVWGPGE